MNGREQLFSRLFAANSAMYAFTSIKGLASFVERLISTLPGIEEQEVCLLDLSTSEKRDSLNSKFLGELRSEGSIFGLKDYENLQANFEKIDVELYPVRTADAFYGFIAVKIKDFDIFIFFDAVISNFAIAISTILENRYQKNTLLIINNELEEHKRNLEKIVDKRTQSLNVANRKLRCMFEETIYSLAKTVESRDPYTAGHQYRVAKLAEAIALKMNLSKSEIHDLYLGALIHDIGKIKVPFEILSSPIHLTKLQFDFIKLHPVAGKEIIEPISFGPIISDIVLHHHERLNGSGYPDGLMEDEIMLTTKIVSVADVYEAMISHRPYRPRRTFQEAIHELQVSAGLLYDAVVVDHCIKLILKEDFKLPTPPQALTFYL